jgi:hypothetical protein
MVKSLTSLALFALAVTAAAPASAVSIETSSSSTLSASEPGAPPSSPPAVVKVTTHRSRKTTKRGAPSKGVDHHAEPARSPVIVTAAVSRPLALAKVRVTKVSVKAASHAPVRAHAKGEVMIGPKPEVKVVTAPTKPIEIPAEVDVKTEAGSFRPAVKIEAGRGRIEVKPPAKVTVGIRPVALRTTQETAVEDAPSDPHATLDIGTGEPKLVAAAARPVPAPVVQARAAKTSPRPACLRDGVAFIRGQEAETFSLTRCDGSVAPLALEKLSILARPDSAPLPKSAASLAKVKGPEIATGIRRIDPGLVERIQTVADHFSKIGPVKVSVISGYRPMSSGSYHATGQAIDLRVEGVPNEAVVEFCKTLADTGCGYYPNSSFVHVDVRQSGTGHVAWIDASGPGEAPRYVASWPPPPEPDVKSAEKATNPIDKLDPELPELPSDDHPAAPGISAVLPTPLEVAK